MRKIIRFVLYKPILWLVETFSSAPDRDRVFKALSELKKEIEGTDVKKGFVIPFDPQVNKFIIFSDHHKGRRNGADDFAAAEPNYVEALEYYEANNYHLIALGDCEELWENTLLQVLKANAQVFARERNFARRNGFTKIFGNHDLDWDIDPLAPVYLKQIYGQEVRTLKAVMLQAKVGDRLLNIFCTHGHQGDMQSDGNWFSKFFVAKVWAPLQSYLKINPNTPAYDQALKTNHNKMMYEWSAQQADLILITGHTHQPVFESLTHLERLERKSKQALYEHNREWAEALDAELSWTRKDDLPQREDYLKILPTYFNSGCCCFADGDITGIEIAENEIRLIKWETDAKPERKILERKVITDLVHELPHR
jgi:UDP-2,3-diacylglucosamine pyrophosphatase LpxH